MLSEDKLRKCVKGACGGVLVGAGVAAKLADYGLSVAEVVLNGAENLADHFVKAPKLGIGKALFDSTHKAMTKLSARWIKKGKEMF